MSGPMVVRRTSRWYCDGWGDGVTESQQHWRDVGRHPQKDGIWWDWRTKGKDHRHPIGLAVGRPSATRHPHEVYVVLWIVIQKLSAPGSERKRLCLWRRHGV